MNAAFSEIQDGAFSHLPLLQFLYGQGLAEGQGRKGKGRLGGGERRVSLGLKPVLWKSDLPFSLVVSSWDSGD